VLSEIARRLDEWIVARNVEARVEGWPPLRPCEIRVIGQAALLEAGTALTLVATRDVDVRANWEHTVEQEFRRLLAKAGLELDPLGHEAWMPQETEYGEAFAGLFVTLLIADADAVLVAKGLKAPVKNRALIVEYLSRGASPRFLSLAKKYGLQLEKFL
jgi:hypothetical protein